MPSDKSIRPGLLTPSAILVSWALHLSVPWLLLATLGADWWSPVQAIEQSDSVKEGHLAQLLDFLVNLYLYLYLYLYLGRFSVGATCLPMLPVATQFTGSCLPLWAFLRLMAPLPAMEALDLAWVALHEDRHFYRSMDAGNEWRWFGGCVDRGREGSFQLILNEVVEVCVLNPDHGTGQFLLGDGVLLHDFVQMMLRISTQLVEGVPELHFSSEMIDFPDYSGVSHICDHLVDQEFLGGTTSEFPPLSCGHGGVVVGLSTDVDWDGVLGVAPAVSSSNIHIVGIILYVLGDFGAIFVVPFPILWVWDVDGVEVVTFKLIVNEARRCRVGIFHHALVVDAAEPVFLDRD